ncbi:hypothetical protein N825_32885 [Skermanella stibiiresistens SB22]|uniref:Uncharacterized protein n=1 Tax=Skermanella stibiiresistens SB22 TaxID=1385369 RepID=W9H3G6_9PROT|nr:hypothetical protein [Skermanella stibiiresistens]EWY40725.1 hypothetical protein N825_32885 [Skermanella stibiiresistens SB22]
MPVPVSRLPAFLFLAIMVSGLPAGCVSAERQYSSGENGPVDCGNFPIKSSRQDLKPDDGKTCFIVTDTNIQAVGTGYLRRFSRDGSVMIASLEVAGLHTYIVRKNVRELLSVFPEVKNTGVNWVEQPSMEVGDQKYETQKFSLNQQFHTCMGFSTYGNTAFLGYARGFYGYSCKHGSKGVISADDLRRDLEALDFRM